MGFVRVQTTCQACGGNGKVISDPCSDCRGKGLIADRVTKPVVIPAGIDDGMRVRVSGEGLSYDLVTMDPEDFPADQKKAIDWVEGALKTSEDMLQNHLGLSVPSWYKPTPGS